ncbi:MAG: DNA methyltransferase [Rhodospirillaceae bacterium]|nr:DNA methyltransferase [Rhodospirillaceae bacterium]MDE0619860.1 DNA methyltransferase [Rhodospirillaceae bacterium]
MTKPNFATGTVWTGDNLPVLRGMNDACVDLIYLDPPFNSNRLYEAPIGSTAAGAAFKDAWTLSDVDVHEHGELADRNPAAYSVIEAARQAHGKGMQAYLVMMAVRLLEMHRVLKPTGSIYLHCDSTASHYLKLLMDGVFGRSMFLACITWRRTYAHNDKMFGSLSEQILWYGNGGEQTKNMVDVVVPFTAAELKKKYPHKDGRGQHMRDNLMASGTRNGESGQAWKGCDPTSYGRHWSVPRTGQYAKYLNDVLLPGYLDIKGPRDRLIALDDAGFIHWTDTGVPLLKRYAMPGQGTIPGDIWTDVPPLSRKTKERTGYPTQKPLALLDRIIRASSNPDDMVLDPFCGCATALVAADRLGRRWAGIDLSPLAVKLVNDRIAADRADKKGGHHIGGSLWGGATALTTPPKRTDLGDLPNYRTHRHRLYGEQEGVCVGCDTHFPFRVMDVDHILPRSRGGTDHPDNLQLLCSGCNRSKGGRTMAEWRATQG